LSHIALPSLEFIYYQLTLVKAFEVTHFDLHTS